MTKVHALDPLRRRIFTDTLLLLRRAARELVANDPLRLGAATAFFTTFALPPILIILIQVMGSLYSASTVRRPAGLPAFGGLIGRRARHWNNATGTTSADGDRSARQKRADRDVPTALRSQGHLFGGGRGGELMHGGGDEVKKECSMGFCPLLSELDLLFW